MMEEKEPILPTALPVAPKEGGAGIKGWDGTRDFFIPTTFGEVFQDVCDPLALVSKGIARTAPRSLLAPSGPSRSALRPALGGGRRRRKAAGPQGPRRQLPSAAARPGPCPPPRGTDPAGRSGPPQDPAFDSPLSTSLPFLAVAAFPMTGRWEEGVREGDGGRGRPHRSTG